MALPFDSSLFNQVHQWNYSVVHVDNPARGQGNPILSSDILKITVVDSGCVTKNPPLVAVMFIPIGRENDWLFCMPAGYSQLMEKYFGISRLILVGNMSAEDQKNYHFVDVAEEEEREAKEKISRIIGRFIPITLRHGEDHVTFLKFNDGLVYRTNVITNSEVPKTDLGNFSVHSEVRKVNGVFEARRVLRFMNTGHWVHTEREIQAIHLRSKQFVTLEDGMNWQGLKFKNEKKTLVDPNCAAMLNGLTLMPGILMKDGRSSLCLGGNGAVLADFLTNRLDFKVGWVEGDSAFLGLAKAAFGVKNCYNIYLDWKEFIQQDAADVNLTSRARRNLSFIRRTWNNKFDVIMIHLSEADLYSISGQAAPPRALIKVDMLNKLKQMIQAGGIAVIYVNPPDYLFYADLLNNLKSVFDKVYQIKVDDKNFVVIAMNSGGDAPSSAPTPAPTKEKGFMMSLKYLALKKVGATSSAAEEEDVTQVLNSVRKFPIEEVTQKF